MKYLTGKRLLIILIVVVTALNLASLSAIVYLTYYHDQDELSERQPLRGYHQRNQKRPDKETRLFFEEVRKEFVGQVHPIAEELHYTQTMMMKELMNDHPNQATLDSLAEVSGQLHARIKKQMTALFLKMNSNATPEQKQHLERFYRHFMTKDGAGPPHERRRGKQRGKNFRQAPQGFCD